MDLFEHQRQQDKRMTAPLADRMRPKTFDVYGGQEHLVGEGKMLRRLIIQDQIPSMIFWGPPGTGKTTLAHLIAQMTGFYFVKFSAVDQGVKDVRGFVAEGIEREKFEKKRTILFIDEIHRFNKLQQDAFLPHVEDGTIILIGATTENPSFEINSALLSRSKVFVLNEISESDLKKLIHRALADKERGLGELGLGLETEAERMIISASNGDSRIALNILEDAASLAQEKISKELIDQLLQHQVLRYDKKGDEHYNTISAFIKSLRGSDPNASLYYLARMFEA